MRPKIEKGNGKWIIREEDNGFPKDIFVSGKNIFVGYGLRYINVSGDISLIKDIMEKFYGSSTIIDYLQKVGFKVFQFIYHEGEMEILAGGDIEINPDTIMKEVKEIDKNCELAGWQKVEGRLGIGLVCH